MLKNKKIQGIMQITLSLVLLSYLIWRAGPAEVAGTLANIEWTWYLPAFLLFLVNIVLRAYRWYMLLHTLDERPSFLQLVYLYFVGFFANNFIPSGFGGDVVKVLSLRRRYGSGTDAFSSVLMDRLTGLLGSSLIAIVALTWNSFSRTTAVELPLFLWTAVFVISIAIPGGFLLLRWQNPLRYLVSRVPTVRRIPKFNKIEQLVHTVRRYPMRILLRALLISLPFTLSLIVVQYSIARALGVQLPISIFSLFVPIIAILNLLPISFNGLGVREGVYKFLFIPIGVAGASAVAMSLAFYFLRFGAGVLGGVFYASRSVMTAAGTPTMENL